MLSLCVLAVLPCVRGVPHQAPAEQAGFCDFCSAGGTGHGREFLDEEARTHVYLGLKISKIRLGFVLLLVRRFGVSSQETLADSPNFDSGL